MRRKRQLPFTLGCILNAARRCIMPYTPEADLEVRVAGRAYLDRLDALRGSALRGDGHRCHNRSYWLLTAPAAKLCAMILSYPKKRQATTIGDLKRRSHCLNMRQHSGELPRTRGNLKSDGRVRITSRFGLLTRAAQRLATDVLKAQCGDSAFEYSRRGRGREAAHRLVLHNIRHKEVRHVGEIDLKDYFPSFDRNKLAEMIPLPRAVIRNHLLIPNEVDIITLGHTPISETAARAGLPQGSLASPYIASKLLEPILGAVKTPLKLAYIDNVLIGGKAVAEVDVELNSLASSLMKHPAGPHSLKYRYTSKVGAGLDWLGYSVRQNAPAYGGFARSVPSPMSICKEKRRLFVTLFLSATIHHEAAIERWARAWPSRYPIWASRRTAPDNAEIDASAHISPVVRRARKLAPRLGRKFKSFADLKMFARDLAKLIQPEPNWSLIEWEAAECMNKGESTSHLLQRHKPWAALSEALH